MGYSEKWVRPDYQLYISPSYQGVLIGIDDMNLLQTLTASNSPSLTTTVSLSSVYDRYLLILEGLVPATNATNLRLRVNVGGVQTTNYLASINNGLSFDQVTTYIPLAGGTNAVANAAPGIVGQVNIWQPWDTGAPKIINGWCAYQTGASAQNGWGIGYYTASNAAVTALELSMTSGNLTSGTAKLYGIYGT